MFQKAKIVNHNNNFENIFTINVGKEIFLIMIYIEKVKRLI